MKNEVENKTEEKRRWLKVQDGCWLKVYENYKMVIVETYSESLWLEADDAINLAYEMLEAAHKVKYKQEADDENS